VPHLPSRRPDRRRRRPGRRRLPRTAAITIGNDLDDDGAFLADTAYNRVFDFCENRGLRLEVWWVERSDCGGVVSLMARAVDGGYVDGATVRADRPLEEAATRLLPQLRRTLAGG
jgi:hypothetical protein